MQGPPVGRIETRKISCRTARSSSPERVRQGSGPANVARTVICPCPASAVADSADPGSGGRGVNRRKTESGSVGVFPPHPITNARNSTTTKRMGVLCTNAALIDSCPDFTQFYIERRHLALLVFTEG